jgi:hypothetical protein
MVPHWSGLAAHMPLVRVKHQPQPWTGVHVPQEVYGEQSVLPPPPPEAGA